MHLFKLMVRPDLRSIFEHALSPVVSYLCFPIWPSLLSSFIRSERCSSILICHYHLPLVLPRLVGSFFLAIFLSYRLTFFTRTSSYLYRCWHCPSVTIVDFHSYPSSRIPIFGVASYEVVEILLEFSSSFASIISLPLRLGHIFFDIGDFGICDPLLISIWMISPMFSMRV